MNEFLKDALSNLRRASALLAGDQSEEAVQNAILQFAFGVERIFKSIVSDVNPLFILEREKFENALGVLYRDKLIPAHRKVVEKEAAKQSGFNRNVLPFKGSMLRAAKFSQTVEDNIGAFTKLSDMRGVVAHRHLSELNRDEAWRFMLRIFHPTVERFAAELGYPAAEAFEGHSHWLAEQSLRITAEENLKARLDKLFAEHAKRWEKAKSDAAHVAKAERSTAAALKNDPNRDTISEDTLCPACGRAAILTIEVDWDVEGASGPGFVTGVYVSGLECYFCGLQLNDYEEFDYLKLNEGLAQ